MGFPLVITLMANFSSLGNLERGGIFFFPLDVNPKLSTRAVDLSEMERMRCESSFRFRLLLNKWVKMDELTILPFGPMGMAVVTIHWRLPPRISKAVGSHSRLGAVMASYARVHFSVGVTHNA